MGNVAEVSAPTIGDVAGITMRVLMRPPGSTLYVQANVEYFIYLTKVVAHQIEGGTIKRLKPIAPVHAGNEVKKQEVEEPLRIHLSNATSKPDCIRARHVVKTGGAQKSIQAWFSISKLGKDRAIEMAQGFVISGERGDCKRKHEDIDSGERVDCKRKHEHIASAIDNLSPLLPIFLGTQTKEEPEDDEVLGSVV